MLCNNEDYQPIVGFYSCVFFGSERTDRPMFCLPLWPGPSVSGNREALIVIFSGSLFACQDLLASLLFFVLEQLFDGVAGHFSLEYHPLLL